MKGGGGGGGGDGGRKERREGLAERGRRGGRRRKPAQAEYDYGRQNLALKMATLVGIAYRKFFMISNTLQLFMPN